ncbi:MBL fold metallo-hydrolase [Chloroflexota bacterium]
MSIQKVKNRIYVDTAYLGSNVSAVATDKGMVLIDTPFLPNEIQQWQKEITEATNQEIAYVINTDYHFDHCLGSALLSPNVIAHQLSYQEMTKPDGTMRDYFMTIFPDITPDVKQQIHEMPLAMPQYSFSDRMWLRLGDATFELIHVGGHTDATIIIYLVEDKVLFTGDAAETNQHPYKGRANFRQWIEALKRIQDIDFDVMVPGHGEVSDKAEAVRMLVYFEQLWDEVSRLHKEGRSKEEVVDLVYDILFNYYPSEPGMEARTKMMFDEGTARMFDEVSAISIA